MSLLDVLPHKCTIAARERVKASGGDGVPLEVFTAVSTDVECWIQQMSSSEMSDYQKRGVNVNRKVFFAANPDIHEGMTIVMTEQNGVAIAEAEQESFDVMSSPNPDASAGLGVVWRVACNSTDSPRDFQS